MKVKVEFEVRGSYLEVSPRQEREKSHVLLEWEGIIGQKISNIIRAPALYVLVM